MHSDIDRLTRLTRSDVDRFCYMSCMIINVYVACLIQQRAVCNACFAPACYQGVMAIVERVRAIKAFLEGVQATAHFKVFADAQKENLLQLFRDEAIDVGTASALLDAVKELPMSNGRYPGPGVRRGRSSLPT